MESFTEMLILNILSPEISNYFGNYLLEKKKIRTIYLSKTQKAKFLVDMMDNSSNEGRDIGLFNFIIQTGPQIYHSLDLFG